MSQCINIKNGTRCSKAAQKGSNYCEEHDPSNQDSTTTDFTEEPRKGRKEKSESGQG